MTLITHLRPALPQDCDDIYQAHQYAVRYTCARSYTDTVLNAWLALLDPQSYLASLNCAHKKLWVITYKNRIQGFFQLDIRDSQLDALYVHPFMHNQGLGTALLHRAESVANEAGLGFIKLFASVNSIAFYTINGYEPLGDAVLPLNPQVAVDCQLMRKYLR